MAHPEDELERLTKKMLFDMDNPPSEEYFGKTGWVGWATATFYLAYIQRSGVHTFLATFIG